VNCHIIGYTNCHIFYGIELRSISVIITGRHYLYFGTC